jgi:hypothetical protein
MEPGRCLVALCHFRSNPMGADAFGQQGITSGRAILA